MKISKRILMNMNRGIRWGIFCRRGFVHKAFRVRVVAGSSIQSYCEWNSIMHRLVLDRYLRPGIRMLDMGTGAHALMAIYSKKQCHDLSVVATDILPERVKCAYETSIANGVCIEFRVADIFDGIDERFDLILFAPPIIPSEQLQSLGFSAKCIPGIGSRFCWSGDGGTDGLEIMRPFCLQLIDHLTDHGRAIVCVNPAHCPPGVLLGLFHQAGLVIEHIHRLPGIMRAYVLRQPTL